MPVVGVQGEKTLWPGYESVEQHPCLQLQDQKATQTWRHGAGRGDGAVSFSAARTQPSLTGDP